MIITVAADGTGDFTAIQQAVDAAPASAREPVIIRVRIGEYHEKLHINKNNLLIVGDVAERVILWNSDNAKQTFPDGTEKGTFLSYTAIITGNDVELRNMTVRNDAGPGSLVGQALAVYAAGDRTVFRNVHMLAHQDTLFCGPATRKVCDNALPYSLPVSAVSAGDSGYTGNRQYFENCVIKGDVDFIFGPYTCWFEACTLICNNRGSEVNGWYTAANTPVNQPNGFVFNRCKLTGDGCADATVFLGRPWRAYARTVFLNCETDACVKPEGWQDWAEKPVTYRYAEYGTTGARADTGGRHAGARVLTRKEADCYSVKSVLSGTDDWHPQRPVKRVFIAGDTAAADRPEDAYPAYGWGQFLKKLAVSDAVIHNEAAAGCSAKRYVGESRLVNIEHCLREGDVLLIHFGAFDAVEGVDPVRIFPRYLAMFVYAARERGAEPVLLTPLGAPRYAAAVRALAREMGVRLVDLERWEGEDGAALRAESAYGIARTVMGTVEL